MRGYRIIACMSLFCTRYLSSYEDTILIHIHPIKTYCMYHSTSQQIRRRKSTHTQTQLLLLQLCIHSCDRDTMVVQCHLHQLNLRYSSGRLFTIVVVCLMIVVLSATFVATNKFDASIIVPSINTHDSLYPFAVR